MPESIEDLFPFYALGTLSEAERAQVEAYVAGHPEARRTLEAMVSAAARLPEQVPAVPPSAELKQKLMARVTPDARKRREAGWREALRGRWSPAFVFASLLLAVVTGAWALALNSEVARLRVEAQSLRDQLAAQQALAEQVARLQTETAALRQQLQSQNQVIVQISSPGARALSIAGTEHQPNAYGQLIANPERGTALLVVSGLAPLQPGRTYQFWLIQGQTPVSAGVFVVDEQGQAIVPLNPNAPPISFDAMGVSIEPEGGSEQPTGDIVMLGEIS